jgi:ribosomal protein S18 acetylase RimI-like enzyme
MPGDVIIRDATVDDLPALRAMLIATWHATYGAIYGAERVTWITDRWHSIAQLHAELGADRVALVADIDNAIVGHAYASVSDGAATLWRLYVHPDAQRQGIGTRLLEAAFSRASPHQRQCLEVEPANTAAIAFYERLGFTEVGRVLGTPDMPAALRMARGTMR